MRSRITGLVTAACLLTAPAVHGETKGAPMFARLKEVPFTSVKIVDAFWAPRQETNRRVSLKHSLDMLEKAGNVRNFELAAAGARTGYSGPVFMDSDLYKGLEAVAYSLATHPDPALEARVDGIIAKIAAAQREDGYLNTHYQVNEPDRRWTNLRDNHELYCAGHLFEAAAAHFRATGKRTLLNVARRYADHIDSVFGPGKRLGYCGHPEIELALVKLWQVTGEKRYLDLSRFFVVSRGSHVFAREHSTPEKEYDGSYWQDDVPIYQHRNIKGHAVRAAYLLAGAVDIARETNDQPLLDMVDRVWRNTTQKQMYVTGGIGPSAHNEGFTVDYDLPNRTAYQETCASVAMIFWNHRLALLYGDGRYADLVERALYNGALAGVSFDGKKFFYVNPLSSAGTHHRSDWFGCACCPPNVTRLLASLGSYLYSQSDDSIWVNLYAQSAVDVKLAGGNVHLDVATRYPWEGSVQITLRTDRARKFRLHLRQPGWARSASVTVNGKKAAVKADRGYIALERTWKTGDTVELTLPMPVERVAAHPQVKENAGKLAIQRGPLIYCLEAVDNRAPLHTIGLPADAPLKPEPDSSLGNGVVAMAGEGEVVPDTDWKGSLYQRYSAPTRVPVRAVPYYAWDNRKPGAMEVWLPVAPPSPPATLESRAKVTVSFANSNAQPGGIVDGVEPKSSGEQPAQCCHWWPHQGTEEWAQLTWKTPISARGVRVYWFDDTGRGACRLPKSWRIEYLDGTTWTPVKTAGAYGVAADRWCEVAFEPVQTKALRLVVQMQPGWAAGVHELRVIPDED